MQKELQKGKREAETVSIIGGADGSTSIFIAGKSKTKKKKPFKECVRQYIYKFKRKRAEKGICANPHTLKEVIIYADKKYHITEIPKTKKKYIELYSSAKQGLIIMHKPELLGSFGKIARPNVLDEESAKEWFRQIQLYSEKIAAIPDHEMPMDFHVYEIKMADERIEMEIDFIWNIFSISYSGGKKTIKKMDRIVQDLYVYYGVSEDDIKNKTKRYSSLLTILSSK